MLNLMVFFIGENNLLLTYVFKNSTSWGCDAYTFLEFTNVIVEHHIFKIAF